MRIVNGSNSVQAAAGWKEWHICTIHHILLQLQLKIVDGRRM